MHNIANNIGRIKTLVDQTRINSQRIDDEITILAASKGQGPEKIVEAWQAGIRCFGENYLQEALKKMAVLTDLKVQWHFIGAIQSNKTRDIAAHFSWVHTVDRLRTAKRLNQHRQGHGEPLNICIQVNIDGEPNKSGVAPKEAMPLARAIAELPKLRLRGLMVLPRLRSTFDAQREAFRRTAELLEAIKNSSPQLRCLDTLSMGMSDDLAAAVTEGATIVRIGTGIFGPRQTRAPT